MIEPTEKDIGRRVEYSAPWEPDYKQLGVITSFNRMFVFVRYDSQPNGAPGQATARTDLHWMPGQEARTLFVGDEG